MQPSEKALAVAGPIWRARGVVVTAQMTAALLVGLTGVADLVASFLPRTPLAHMLLYWPLSLEFALRTVGVVAGFFLIMLAQGLARGKRHAWQVTLWLLAASLVWQLTQGRVLTVIWLTALIGLLLGSLAPFFRARSDPPSLWRGYAALVGSALLVYLYALGGTLVIEHRLAPIESLERLSDGLGHLVDSMPIIQGHVTPEVRLWLFERTLAVTACCAMLYGLGSILRPAISALHVGHETDQQGRARVAQLAQRWGSNTLAAFALAPEKRYFFAAQQRGVVVYAVAERLAVVAGDPLAAPDALPGVLTEFLHWCARHDLQVALWQVGNQHLPLYHRLGLQTLKIGEEAVVDLPDFTLQGGAMQNVRTTLRHAEKAGVTVRFFTGSIDDPALASDIEAISAAWLASKGGPEMGFSMGRWHDAYLTGRLIAVAVAGDGRALAFTTFVPVGDGHSWALDLMRRDPQSVAGTMELLLVRSIERLRESGVQSLSLGLAPLANYTQEPITHVGQLCSAFSAHFGSNRQADSLTQFKRKFGPRWEPRYLGYPGTLTLPRVGLAILSVHLCRPWLSLRSLWPPMRGIH